LQVLYKIEDKKNPAPKRLLKLQAEEDAFNEDYLQRTGIHWRHFHGPKGPRGPPVLHMWEAKEIGQKHLVESSEGYWFYLIFMISCNNKNISTFFALLLLSL
jgi:hypothetical protein